MKLEWQFILAMASILVWILVVAKLLLWKVEKFEDDEEDDEDGEEKRY